MADIIKVSGYSGLLKALKRDLPKVRKRVMKGALVAAKQTAHYVILNMPIAFGELRSSVHAEQTPYGAKTSADAPHAAAVEVGSRPHWVPIEPLLAWTMLRGRQGLSRTGRIRSATRKALGNTTARQSNRVASQLKEISYNYSGGTASPSDAPMQLARAIQAAIAKRGTKPTFYMRNALYSARMALFTAIEDALHRAP